ncbi:MAG: hypothetical protein WBO19_15480 [Terriglobia bacterium]|jgi:hypothetical protein
MPEKNVDELLKDAFHAKHADAAVKHFRNMVGDYQKSEWADAAAKGGKFVEAVMKALWVKAGETLPLAKDFSVGVLIDKLQQKPAAAGIPDTIKLTIPRACRFAYEIASNRGARHDAYEIDANEMDAAAVLAVCSWILSEMVRFSQRGLDLAGAKAAVEGLMRRRFPFTEEVDGRVYTEVGSSAPDTALGILLYIYPKRMPESELIESLARHGYKHHNASVAVQRLKPYVDTDAVGNVRLRNTGVRKAESLISRAAECTANKRKVS